MIRKRITTQRSQTGNEMAIIVFGSHPDPLKDPKNGTPQNDPRYYAGKPRGLLGVSIFGSSKGGLGPVVVVINVLAGRMSSSGALCSG